jgi:hypothetical protein|nr:MAG TPA: asparaginyl-tRNA synthetase [Caudoviricetes sp.]
MTLINDLLKKIKEAIYGEEVRNSIHDAIEQCYKDATGHPDSVAATVKEIGEVSANLSKETAGRKAEVNTERKRIDNLIANGTAQTQEIGKTIIQDSSIYSSGIVLKGLTGNNYYYKLFEESRSIDSEFCTITNQQGKYTAKLLKPGLYYMNFKVHVEMSGGFSEEVIAPLKLFKSNTLDWSTFDVLDAETVEISKTENTSINKKIHFLFRVAEPSYIRIYIDVDTSHTKTITFRIDGCDIIALDWKGKQSADLSELHDLRIGADGVVHNTAGEAVRKQIGNLTEGLDNKIEHVGGYKEYDIGAPSVGTYWNKSAKKQLESETYQSFNPISLKAGTYHYENMSGSFTFYEDTDGNWIPIGKYSASGNGDVVITNDTTIYITEMQKSGVFVGAKLSSGDIAQKESNWFKNPKYDIDNINNTLESLSDSVNDIKSVDGSAIKEYCIYVSTTGSDTSGDGSEEKPFATIYHANETITDNSYTKRYRIIVLPGTYTDLQDKYTGITPTGKYQGVITKPWVTYESKSGNPKDTIIEWDGSTGLENPRRDDVVEKCAFHIVSLPRTFTAIKGFTVKSKNARYAMHCESSGRGIQGEWLIENCIFDWGGCPDISDDTGKVPAIGIGMSPCEKGTIKFCKFITNTVETMLVHDGKNNDGNSAVILGAELNFIKCDLGTGRLQFQSIYPKSGEINAKTNNVCNLVSCTQINNLYSYISSLNSDGEMVWRVYGKDCDFASYGNMSDYVYKIGTANNVSN